jgi:hypothetical protein
MINAQRDAACTEHVSASVALMLQYDEDDEDEEEIEWVADEDVGLSEDDLEDYGRFCYLDDFLGRGVACYDGS